MASNRLNARTRAASTAASAETPRDALAAVARQSARVQIAALAAAGKFLVGWARAADRYAQAISDELLCRVDGQTDSRGLIVGVATATNVHLRELTTLPSAAANHFDARLVRESIDN